MEQEQEFYRKYLEIHKTKKISVATRKLYAKEFPIYNTMKRYTAIVVGVKRGGEKHAINVISVKWFHELNYLIERFPLTLDMIHGKAYGPMAPLFGDRCCRVEKLSPAYRGMTNPPKNKWAAVSGIKSMQEAREYIDNNRYAEINKLRKSQRSQYRIRILKNPIHEIRWWD